MKENEKEEARLAARKKAEEEEKLGRVRRLEARQKREEEERLRREEARERRRLDREERERKAQAGEEEEKWGLFLKYLQLTNFESPRTNAGSSIDIVGDDSHQRKASAKTPKGSSRTKTVVLAVSSSASASGSRTPVGEDWMLDCEICHRSGVNKVNGCAKFSRGHGFAHTWKLQDDGSPLLCCGKCARWQHIACHDSADRKAGRPKRDWDKEEFICRACQGRGNANGRQILNGSSASYDAGRTPSPYYHQTSGYAGQAPSYGQNYSLPHHSRPPYQQHTAITFSHYQPQQRGFTSIHSSPHAQAMPQTPTYTPPHYSTHGSPSKLTQYPTFPASYIFDTLSKVADNVFFFFLIARSSYKFERHDLARADVRLFLSCTLRRHKLAHACAASYQLRDGTVVLAVVVQLERGALFNARRWRRVCYFCGGGGGGCCCAEWERGCGGFSFGCGVGCYYAAAVLARKPVRGFRRWWRRRRCILLPSSSTVTASATT